MTPDNSDSQAEPPILYPNKLQDMGKEAFLEGLSFFHLSVIDEALQELAKQEDPDNRAFILRQELARREQEKSLQKARKLFRVSHILLLTA